MSATVGTQHGKDLLVYFFCRYCTLNGLSSAKKVSSEKHFPQLPLNSDWELNPKIIPSFI